MRKCADRSEPFAVLSLERNRDDGVIALLFCNRGGE